MVEQKLSKFSTLSGHMIKCLLTDFGQAGRVNIWLSIMTHGPRCAQSVCHDLQPNIFPCVTFGQFSLFLISRLGVFILENKEKTPGFLLHSFVIRFISNHSTSYHGYKRNDHEPNIFFRALCLDNFHYFLFSLWEWLFSRTKKKKKSKCSVSKLVN